MPPPVEIGNKPITLQATASQYKLIKKVKDENLDPEKLQQYTLLINTGVRDFQVGVINEDNRVLFFEDFVLNETKDHTELLGIIESIFDSHELLQAGFWKQVFIGVKNYKFVQVPSSLFSEDATLDYLKFNAKIEEDETVLYTTSSRTEAVTVFAIHTGLHQFLMGFYKNVPVKFIHQSHAIIGGCLAYAKSDQPLYIYVDRFKIHILCLRNHRLAYYNQFAIKQFSDYVKYIMLVMKSMSLDQQTSQVVLWGYIGKNSPHYQEFIKYINNVSFGGRLPGLKYGYMFDEVQEHHFIDLFALSLAG